MDTQHTDNVFSKEAISISIHPHIISYQNMEKEGIFDTLIELFKKIAHRYVISKEMGKTHVLNTHYQCYIWAPMVKINGVRIKLDRLLKPYLKMKEGDQKGRNKIWMKVKKFSPRAKDIVQSSMFGLGYCLKEGGLNSTNFARPELVLSKKYYADKLMEIEKAKQIPIIICGMCQSRYKKITPLLHRVQDDKWYNPHYCPEHKTIWTIPIEYYP